MLMAREGVFVHGTERRNAVNGCRRANSPGDGTIPAITEERGVS